METNTLQWFAHTNFARLEIKKCTGEVCDEVVIIDDAKIIADIVARISELPVQGEMMKSWADDVEIIELLFISEQGNQRQEIYRGSFKTPSTGFNSASSAETLLYTDILGYCQKG